MKIKALAKSKKSGITEWYKDLFTDGAECFMTTPYRGVKPLHNVTQIWVSIDDDERGYVCVFEAPTTMEVLDEQPKQT